MGAKFNYSLRITRKLSGTIVRVTRNHFMGLILTTALVVVTLFALPAQILAGSTSVWVDSPVSLDHASSGNISVNIAGDRVGAFELNITCDIPDLLRFDKVNIGNGPNGFTVVANIKSPNDAAIAGFMTVTSITGNLVIANISFTATGKPGHSVSVYVTGKLYDPEGNEIQGVVFSNSDILITGKDNSYLHLAMIGVGGALVLGALSFLVITQFRSHKRKQGLVASEGIELVIGKEK